MATSESSRPSKRVWSRAGRWIATRGIFLSALLVLAALLAIGGLVWIGLTRLLRDAWPWQVNGLETSTPGFQVLQVVLTLVGGLGAAILVVVAYRRQRDLETARFDDRFAAAAAQLGADTAAERFAGVYAMAALADTWEQHRQQCINVLCAYLRLPYDPGAGLLAEVVSEHTWPVGGVDQHGRGATGKETRTYRSLPNDREVRHTIIRVITEHLRDTAAATTSWQGRDFDFTGAVFDGGDFSQARFAGGRVSFAEATFAAGQVKFVGTVFDAEVSFIASRFLGSEVYFNYSRFRGGMSFQKARFTRGTVWFTATRFESGDVNFYSAYFQGTHVRFWRTAFVGSQVAFEGARFSAGDVEFDITQFNAGSVTFDAVELTTGRVSLQGAEGLAWPTKDGKRFEGWPTSERDTADPQPRMAEE